MKREKLLKSEGYWMAQLQSNLFGTVEKYLKNEKISRQSLASKLGVSKGYISQILNGDFDHKMSKMVQLSLACNYVPVLTFVNADEYILNDQNNKVYDLIPMIKPTYQTFEIPAQYPEKKIDPFTFVKSTKEEINIPAYQF
jgi:transcriptional regulator with XRE-family HTH domain